VCYLCREVQWDGGWATGDGGVWAVVTRVVCMQIVWGHGAVESMCALVGIRFSRSKPEQIELYYFFYIFFLKGWLWRRWTKMETEMKRRVRIGLFSIFCVLRCFFFPASFTSYGSRSPTSRGTSPRSRKGEGA